MDTGVILAFMDQKRRPKGRWGVACGEGQRESSEMVPYT